MHVPTRAFATICGVAVVIALLPARGTGQAGAVPTFSKDVAPILYKNCTTCHRPGEVGPMSLLTYEQARPFARAIREKVAAGVMPPWHADPAYGKFANDRSLSAADKAVITRWADGGAPQGDPKDLPAQPTYATGWQIGQPDAVFTMPTAFSVPATGEIPYKFFEVQTNFTEDKWVEAFEIRPGNRAVVHHVLVYARYPGMEQRPSIAKSLFPTGGLNPQLQREPRPGAPAGPATGGTGPLFGGTAPGTPPAIFEPGTAMLVKAGTVFTFQLHYTTNGTAGTDQSSIGLRFAKTPPTTEVRTMAMMNVQVRLPAGAPDTAIPSGMEFTEDVTLYGFVPHTHLRGKSWEHKLVYPDGREEIILKVPKYDFNWQTEYVFAKPLKVAKGTQLKAVAHYDNSAANKANPDPTKDVMWGDQTWEEMQYTSITFSVDKDRVTPSSQEHQH